MKILLTGASGFLGQHILSESRSQGHEVMCLRHSEFENCEEKVRSFAPNILIHAAWGGVSAADRNDASVQQQNINMSRYLVDLYPYRQIIGLGSQDEYGVISEVVDEGHPLCPVSEYAKAKIAVCNYIADKCADRGSEWQWIRIFNMYGIHQADNWLIPAIIRRCIGGEQSMDTTKGEQCYAYLYSADFARAVVSMCGAHDKSGIYNLSSSHPLPLKEIFLKIKELTCADIAFHFGAIPYRPNQSMMICGNSQKFKDTFGDFEKTTFEEGLREIINSYKNE